VAAGTSARPSIARWLWLAAAIVAVDQLSKVLVVMSFAHGDSVPVTGFFNLVRVHNAGAAFSFLADAGGWQRWFFVVLGVAASAFIVWMLHANRGQRLLSLALALIMGGAVGNVLDRLVHGHVVDFLQFRFAVLEPIFHGGYFPSFNVADMAISLGAFTLIADELRRWLVSRRRT
jgi:signal peptidase II